MTCARVSVPGSESKKLGSLSFNETHMKSFFDGCIVIQRDDGVAWVASLLGWCYVSKTESSARIAFWHLGGLPLALRKGVCDVLQTRRWTAAVRVAESV